MLQNLLLLIFVFFLIIIYSQIKLLYCIFAFLLIVYLIWLSYKNNNKILLLISIIFLILLIPSIVFYLDLSYMGYPYIFYEKNKCSEMKNKCNNFLRRHFKLIELGKETSFVNGPVIYLVNHHTSESKLIDYFGILTLPSPSNSKSDNKIIVTGGETRWNIIDNLYSNLNIIKLNKSSNGNLNIFLEKSKEELNKGNNLIIFPEGKYSNNKNNWKKLEKLQSGSFILSKETNIPIVPVLISGNNHLYGFKTNENLIIKYLSPLYPSDFSNHTEMKEYCLTYMNKGLKNL